MSRLIVYGDIHGCIEEFKKLRARIKPTDKDIEICVGDIITRGKYSIETLDYIIANNIQSVLGNHEDRLLRYINHQNSGKKNPMNIDTDELHIVKNLTTKHLSFLNSLPLYQKVDDLTILHGGIQNHLQLKNLKKKDRQLILRLRYLNKNGHFLAFGQENEESIFWSDKYNGCEGFIVYGHQWFEEVKINKNSIGIDLGCVFGNKLCSAVFKKNNLGIFNKENYEIYYQTKL